MKIERKIANLLIQKGQTLSLAESCTGGFLSNILTNIPGSSQFFKVGIISYADEAKNKILGVKNSTLQKYGSVSLPSVRQMAQGARQLLRTDFSIAISGIAGPTGGTKIKPVGLTYIAVSSKNNNRSFKFIFKGSRLSIKKQAAEKALKLFLTFLHEPR
ncbi:MAG: CinA family protein [Candidatus Omnitrophica bacterium]|nr:CinA family protein [Candidatus Omnitrophota bacterium]